MEIKWKVPISQETIGVPLSPPRNVKCSSGHLPSSLRSSHTWRRLLPRCIAQAAVPQRKPLEHRRALDGRYYTRGERGAWYARAAGHLCAKAHLGLCQSLEGCLVVLLQPLCMRHVRRTALGKEIVLGMGSTRYEPDAHAVLHACTL